MFLYLFGLPAAGKNFVGGILDEEFGYSFYDGDVYLTLELRDAVREQRSFTEEMRDRFYTQLIVRIGELREEYPRLAFGQATFKERHRRQIAASFPDVVFVLVEANEAVRMARLTKGSNPVTVEYARQIAGFFEPPLHHHLVIVNNSDREAVIDQLTRMLSTLRMDNYS